MRDIYIVCNTKNIFSIDVTNAYVSAIQKTIYSIGVVDVYIISNTEKYLLNRCEDVYIVCNTEKLYSINMSIHKLFETPRNTLFNRCEGCINVLKHRKTYIQWKCGEASKE